MRRYLIEFAAASVGAALGFLVAAEAFDWFVPEVLWFGGDKSAAIFGAFVGLTIGSLAGITVMDRLLYKTSQPRIFWTIFGMVLGVVLSGPAVVAGAWAGATFVDFLHLYSSLPMLIAALISVAFVCVGARCAAVTLDARRRLEKGA